MSTRRKLRDWVRLPPNTGFVGESDRLRAQVAPVSDNAIWEPCLLDCGDPDCREWVTLWTEPDPEHGGKRHVLCHVAECEMFDTETP